MKNKSFKYWTRQDIADRFGLDTETNCQYLEKWLGSETEITEEEKKALERLRKKLRSNVDIWNEQELIIKFIALLIDMVDFDSPDYKSFANRKLSGEIDGEKLSGKVDLMVASGKYEPKAPYFCLHEFKKELGIGKRPLWAIDNSHDDCGYPERAGQPCLRRFCNGKKLVFPYHQRQEILYIG